MLNSYSNAKIYFIISDKIENYNLIYIGSTIKKLYIKMIEYESLYKTKQTGSIYNYKDIIGNIDDWYIKEYQKYPCNNRKELEAYTNFIKKNINCINTRKTYNKDEKRKKAIIYYYNNKENIKIKSSCYYYKNKEMINQKQRDSYKNKKNASYLYTKK